MPSLAEKPVTAPNDDMSTTGGQVAIGKHSKGELLYVQSQRLPVNSTQGDLCFWWREARWGRCATACLRRVQYSRHRRAHVPTHSPSQSDLELYNRGHTMNTLTFYKQGHCAPARQRWQRNLLDAQCQCNDSPHAMMMTTWMMVVLGNIELCLQGGDHNYSTDHFCVTNSNTN